ncbi:MAG: DUF2845 domain-containing protein [Candidatus Liptonbacteria bacterium]|nr:DUF2845 domain-containing protein [Candidatus Liptonbacteria bacterium]
MKKTVAVLCAMAMIFIASGQALSQDAKDKKPEPLTPESQVTLVRFISGEFTKVLKPLPCKKKSTFLIKAEEQAKGNKDSGIRMVQSGCTTTPGARMQITHLEFEKNKIRIDLNGGTNPKKSFRQKMADHVQIGAGSGDGGMVNIPVGGPKDAPKANPTGAPSGFENLPATIILEFKGPVPEMTPDEFKQYLASVLDFSKERSAAVQWIDTRSPEVREAILNKNVIVGMDEEEVIAAVGKPICERNSCKVREADENGVEVETWIYGNTPFVTLVDFVDGKVVRVKKMR